MRITDLWRRARARWPSYGQPMRTETLALIASLFFTLACNGAFWAALTAQKSWLSFDTGYLLIFTSLLMTGLQWLLLLLVINRWTAKPLLILLFCLTAPAVYFMSKYGVYLDKSMLRNIFETDAREASELLDWAMLPYWLGYAVVPAALLWHVKVAHTSLKHAAAARAASLLAAVVMVVAGVWPVMNQLVPTLREHKELRYLVTPSNYIIATVRVMAAQPVALAGERPAREVIAADARRAHSAAGRKPRAFVLVVGETVRSTDWGLNGYPRQTTPELAARDLVNYRSVRSCGTDTATSLPCMFSLYGRQHYDEDKIHNSESLLHVLNRVSVAVRWRDNQSGCKGVCDGLPTEDVSSAADPVLCDGQRCFDGILLQGLKAQIESAQGDTLIVLHMLGNHGPAYYQRYPSAFRRFTPTCDTTDLSECSHEALVNTYDNAILYTDHVLATLINDLKSITTHDTGMLYVSDHGESLGEKNLYLHGVPYVIAPDEQTHVPMAMWLSPGLAGTRHLDLACLARSAQTGDVTHDNLFHTLLGLFDVQTQAYDASLDLMKGCQG